MADLASPMRILAASALFWLPGLGDQCPKMASQYTPDPNPFGWPMSPATPGGICFQKYPMCSGRRQGPLTLPMESQEGCEDVHSHHGGSDLWKRANYFSDHDAAAAWAGKKPVVEISPWMRTVMVKGNFGTVTFKDTQGRDVLYEATQVHLAAPSLHSYGFLQKWHAEMLVVHKPMGAPDEADGSVIFSIGFSEAEVDGPYNPIFHKFGFGGHHPPHGNQWEVEPFGIKELTRTAMGSLTLTYNGSLPMPPCSETVTWIFAPVSDERATAETILQLKNLIEAQHFSDPHGRYIFRNDHHTHDCRKIVHNSLEVSIDHSQSTCQALKASGGAERSAACWASLDGCSHATAAIDSSRVQQGPEPLELQSLVHYSGHKHLEMQPSTYTLDATVAHGGNFGHLMLHGRRFEATKISVKPIGAHVIDGQRFAGELIIEHSLYGDLHGSSAAHGEAHAAKGDHSDGHHGHGRRLEDSSVEGAHKVLLSVPLKLGKESALLRHFGLPNPALKLAMRDGNAFAAELDLSADLQPLMQGTWFWYSGQQLQPGCSEWGVRWIVVKEPLEVSFEQLDFLTLEVSGFDSTPKASSDKEVWKDSVPAHGVEMAGHSDCGSEWSYSNTACWKNTAPICAEGSKQSPINILASSVNKEGSDSFLAKCSWKPLQGLEVTKTELGLQVQSNQLGYIAFVGEAGNQDYYQVTDLVLHMPSEHMIDGKQFDAELQVVHKKQQTVDIFEEEDQIIASFLFKIGDEESPLLKQLLLPNGENQIQQPLDLMRALGPAIDAGFYRYDGSLTTPGCGEFVKWFVFDSPMAMSRNQWAAFKAHFPHGNSRPVQLLGDKRMVTRNSFEEGVLTQQGFYLNRKTARDRSDWGRDRNIILIPILFSLFFSFYVMASLFVREDRDRKAQSNGGLAPAGLEQTIGRPQQYSRF